MTRLEITEILLARLINSNASQYPLIVLYKYTLNKSSNWSSLEIGHPLCLFFAKNIKDMTLKFCIYDSMTLIARLQY